MFGDKNFTSWDDPPSKGPFLKDQVFFGGGQVAWRVSIQRWGSVVNLRLPKAWEGGELESKTD